MFFDIAPRTCFNLKIFLIVFRDVNKTATSTGDGSKSGLPFSGAYSECGIEGSNFADFGDWCAFFFQTDPSQFRKKIEILYFLEGSGALITFACLLKSIDRKMKS